MNLNRRRKAEYSQQSCVISSLHGWRIWPQFTAFHFFSLFASEFRMSVYSSYFYIITIKNSASRKVEFECDEVTTRVLSVSLRVTLAPPLHPSSDMAPNKRSSDSSQPLPTGKKSRKSSGLPAISWTADKSFLTWRLFGEIEKAENFKVLFGKRSKHEVISSKPYHNVLLNLL